MQASGLPSTLLLLPAPSDDGSLTTVSCAGPRPRAGVRISELPDGGDRACDDSAGTPTATGDPSMGACVLRASSLMWVCCNPYHLPSVHVMINLALVLRSKGISAGGALLRMSRA